MLSSRHSFIRNLQKFALNYTKSSNSRVQRLLRVRNPDPPSGTDPYLILNLPIILLSFQTVPLLRVTPLVPIPIFAFSLIGSSNKKTAKKTQPKMAEALQNADQLMDESRYQECLDLLLAQPVSKSS